MRWDTKNRVFVGYFDQGKARVYDCLGVYGAPHKMYEVAMQLEAPIDNDPPSLSFHCHDYIPEHDIHVFVDVPAYLHGDPRTWGFRLDMKTAIPAQAPVIPDGMTLQAVLDQGGTITLNPGTLNDSGKITKAGTVLVGDDTTLQGGGVEVEGKGILLVDASSTVKGITFDGAAVSDGNGAGIRHTQGAGLLTIDACTFVRCQDGYLGNDDVAFTGCTFVDDGNGDGQTHAVYVSNGAKLATATGCTFRGTRIGHHFNSRAAKSVVTSCTMEAATESYSANFPWGGVVEMSDCEITEGADTDNPKIISYGEESPAFTENSITLTRMTLTSSKAGSIGIYVDPRIAAVPMVLTDVHFVGVPNPVVGATNVTYAHCTKDGAAFNG